MLRGVANGSSLEESCGFGFGGFGNGELGDGIVKRIMDYGGRVFSDLCVGTWDGMGYGGFEFV